MSGRGHFQVPLSNGPDTSAMILLCKDGRKIILTCKQSAFKKLSTYFWVIDPLEWFLKGAWTETGIYQLRGREEDKCRMENLALLLRTLTESHRIKRKWFSCINNLQKFFFVVRIKLFIFYLVLHFFYIFFSTCHNSAVVLITLSICISITLTLIILCFG